MHGWFLRPLAIGVGFALAFGLGMLVRPVVPTQAAMMGPQPQIIHVKDLLDGTLPKIIPGLWGKTLAESPDYSVEAYQISSIAPHKHYNTIEFIYVVEGAAKGTLGNTSATVHAGDLEVLPKGVPHSFVGIGGPVKILFFSMPRFSAKDIHFVK